MSAREWAVLIAWLLLAAGMLYVGVRHDEQLQRAEDERRRVQRQPLSQDDWKALEDELG